jgi:hypothetical protein
MRKLWLAFSLSMISTAGFSQNQLESFRGTNQRVALLGWYVDFVEPSVNDRVLSEMRRLINRYSRSFDETAISGFNLLKNPNNQYLNIVEARMDAPQKEFLQKTAKDNGIDILLLGQLRETPSALELQLQLYDARINILSAIESQKFIVPRRERALENLAYRIMNYLDRDGFVHPSPQDFLKKPVGSGSEGFSSSALDSKSSQALSFQDLAPGRLAGPISIGGEKTPFWEKWWFWTSVFGGLALAGGLSYYFLVVNQPVNSFVADFYVPGP